jgi:hypothetical protein
MCLLQIGYVVRIANLQWCESSTTDDDVLQNEFENFLSWPANKFLNYEPEIVTLTLDLPIE